MFGGFVIVVYLCGDIFLLNVSLYNIPFLKYNAYEKNLTFCCYALHGSVWAS